MLDINNNAFTGNVELEELTKGNNLSYLDLSSNKLSLRFNNSISYNLELVYVLGLSSCNISEFPNFLRSSKFLIILDLSQNQIQGSVPSWIGEVSTNYLSIFNLSHNFLTSIEPSLPWKSLQSLDLRSNFFSGPLPILSSSLLISISLSKNHFAGPIPDSNCNSISLQWIDFSYNNLSGEIPPCLVNFSEKLAVLDLQRNNLHGNIPGTFLKKCNLKSLSLDGNLLTGSIPTSLANCRNLELLDLGNNVLNGTFPSWFESLTELRVLVLRSNNFHGSIPNPKSRLSFSELRIMDLSANKFSGALPTELFKNFKAIMKSEGVKMEYLGDQYYYQDSMLVDIKGQFIVLVKIQNILAIIDFSSNNFTGEIPDFLGSLVSLKGLNFSRNMLKGPIPSALGNLTNLEWLDLSNNELVGKIPDELVDLKWLSLLNLSNNELEGPIPRGKQFETFNNDSYSSNLGLCGFPLSKSCNDDMARQDQDDHHGEGNNGLVLDWKVAMMGFASGVAIGLSIGYMVLFTRTFDNWFKKRFGRKPRHISIAPLSS